MLKKISTHQLCLLFVFRQVRGSRLLRLGIIFFLLLFFAGSTNVHAQVDSLNLKEKPGVKPEDSSDLFLSTDTNTHDVRAAKGSLYVPDHQELRHMRPSKIKSYQKEEAFAYANDPEYWQKKKIPEPPVNLGIYFRIFLLICGCFLCYGVYRLAKENFSGLFSRRSKKTKGDTGDPAAPEETLSAQDLETRLAAAIGAGDLRMAVRLMYLKLIRAMQDRQLAPAGIFATNRAWSAVFSDPVKATQFRSLASAYEYVYYGGFVPTGQQFADLQKRFSDFSQGLPA